jgi:hypothetical protein
MTKFEHGILNIEKRNVFQLIKKSLTSNIELIRWFHEFSVTKSINFLSLFIYSYVLLNVNNTIFFRWKNL